MRARILAMVIGGLSAACIPQSLIESSLRRTSSPYLSCSEEQIQVSNYSQGMAGYAPSTWTATGCDRTFNCSLYVAAAGSGLPDRTDCRETAGSESQTLGRVVVDRLSIETGCPPEKIAVVNQASWSRGTETAYRMTACGKPYVCTTSAKGTDCKAALAASDE
jgi:hypothetical protein